MSGNSTPFDGDELPERAAEILRLNVAVLLDTLQRLKFADSITALHDAIVELRRELCDPASRFCSSPECADGIDLAIDYLTDELAQIGSSRTLERAHYYLDRFIKSVTEVRSSPINDINLNRWKEYDDIYTDSLWIVERRDSSGVHSAGYWGNFIPQIPNQMMRRYTKKGDWVLDVFAGSGTTVIEAQRLGRNSIGVELQAAVARDARSLVAAEPNVHGVVSEIITADSTEVDYRAILQRYDRQSVQLVMMHPPYFDIIKFSDDPRDLSNAASVDTFLKLIGGVVDTIVPVLERGRYVALVIGDKYAKGEWIPLGFLTMNEVIRRGFVLKSIIVKNFEETTGKRSQKELWKYRALAGGFYIFKHEYLFIFKKR